MAKARGRKASLDALARKTRELGAGYDNSIMFISHGDCREDAEYLASVLKEQYGVKEVIISYVGAVIGSHSGPGTIAAIRKQSALFSATASRPDHRDSR